jgi:hypothetical protein
MVGLTESLIYSWFDRSHIEYRDLFMRLYIAYNAWYRKVTGKSNDHEAIRLLQLRFVIWHDYIRGHSLRNLRSIMEQIVAMTNTTPLKAQSGSWDGIVKNSDDWQGLIHFWYEVRCSLFHGSIYAASRTKEVQLAYESLYIFMSEVVTRMKKSFHEADYVRLQELRVLMNESQQDTNRYAKENTLLHQKYIRSPELWDVDMIRSSG